MMTVYTTVTCLIKSKVSVMKESIKFKIKKQDDHNSLEIYRPYDRDGQTIWSYIDSCHPMNTMELLTLKNFLQEYLHNNDWY